MRRRLVVVLLTLAAAMVAGSPMAQAADPFESQQWNMDIIGAPAARATGIGAGVRIAIIDSGVDLAHEDLKAKIEPGKDFVNNDDTALDDNGHGTHVAGIAAAATGNGLGVGSVAPGARIVPVKVLSASNTGTTANVEKGIRWATAQRVGVINLSLGGDVVLTQVLGSDLEDAINDAFAAGVVVVVAAGNNGLPISGYSSLNAIVVSATTRDDTEAPYSNGVGTAKWGLAAPGGDASSKIEQNVISTYWFSGKSDSYAALAGTSMATPHVAGAAAVLRERGLTPQQTVDRLLATAKDLGSVGRDSTYGSGRLDLGRAVQGLTPASPSAAPSSGSGAGAASPTTTRPPSGTATTRASSGAASKPAGSTATTVTAVGAVTTTTPGPVDGTAIVLPTPDAPAPSSIRPTARGDVEELSKPLPRATALPVAAASALLLGVLAALPRALRVYRRRQPAD